MSSFKIQKKCLAFNCKTILHIHALHKFKNNKCLIPAQYTTVKLNLIVCAIYLYTSLTCASFALPYLTPVIIKLLLSEGCHGLKKLRNKLQLNVTSIGPVIHVQKSYKH